MRSRVAPADLAIVAGMCVFAVFVTLVAFFHLPAYVGTVPMPVSILVPAGFSWLLPRTAYRLTGRILAAAAPAVAILGTVVVLVSWSNRPLYQLPLRVISIDRSTNTAGENWRTYLLLGAVALTAAATLALLWSDRVAASVPPPVPPSGLASMCQDRDPAVIVAQANVTTATSDGPDTHPAPAPVDTG